MNITPATTLTDVLAHLQQGNSLRDSRMNIVRDNSGMDRDAFKAWLKQHHIVRGTAPRSNKNNFLIEIENLVQPTTATPALTKPLTHAQAKEILEGMKGKTYLINGSAETIKGYLFKGLGARVVIDTNRKMRDTTLPQLHIHLQEYVPTTNAPATAVLAVTPPLGGRGVAVIPVAKNEIEVNAPVTSASATTAAIPSPKAQGQGAAVAPVAFIEFNPQNTPDSLLPATISFRYGRMHLNSVLTNLLGLTDKDTIKFYQHPTIPQVWYIAKAPGGWPLYKAARSYKGYHCNSIGIKREMFFAMNIKDHKQVFEVAREDTYIGKSPVIVAHQLINAK